MCKDKAAATAPTNHKGPNMLNIIAAPTITTITCVELHDCDTLHATAVVPTSETLDTFEQAHAYTTATYGADVADRLFEVDEYNNLHLEMTLKCVPEKCSEAQVELCVDDLPTLGKDVTWMITHVESDTDLATATVH